MSLRRWIGAGWSLPILPDERTGRLPAAEGFEKLRQSIEIILRTEPGERLMRPDFGCGLRRYLMKPNTAATRALIRRDVELALTAWEPRIRLDEVRADPGDDPALVLIRIRYTRLAGGNPENLVFPFYLE